MQRGCRKRPVFSEKGEPKYASDSPQLRRSAMDSNNAITPDQEPSSQQSALKKGEPEICPRLALLMHAFLMQRSFP